MCPLSFTCILPENVWTSSAVFPNKEEPLWNNILDETNVVLNSWAVILPVTVKSPSNVSVVFSKNEPVTAPIAPEIFAAIWAELLTIPLPKRSASASVSLVLIEALGTWNEEDSPTWAEELIKP